MTGKSTGDVFSADNLLVADTVSSLLLDEIAEPFAFAAESSAQTGRLSTSMKIAAEPKPTLPLDELTAAKEARASPKTMDLRNRV